MSSGRELTKRQREVYEFIRSRIRARGYGPTVREIGEEFGIRSPNGVVSHLHALEKKGAIIRQAGKSRAIELAQESPASLPVRGTLRNAAPLESVEASQIADFGNLFGEKETFALVVGDTSLASAHIAEGDLLVVQKRGTPQAGQVVVATLPDGTSVVRRYRRSGTRVRLEPLGTRGKTVSATKPRIVGVVLSVIRNL